MLDLIYYQHPNMGKPYDGLELYGNKVENPYNSITA